MSRAGTYSPVFSSGLTTGTIQARFLQRENRVAHDAYGQVQVPSYLFGRHGASSGHEMLDDLVHDDQQCLFPVFEAHLSGGFFELEFPDILIGERELGSEQHDLPARLKPDQEQWGTAAKLPIIAL